MPYVDVLPLQPPFDNDYRVLSFKGFDKPLAVSIEDWQRIADLLASDNPIDRMIELSQTPGDERIRITVIVS
jgi:hypothetical protein